MVEQDFIDRFGLILSDLTAERGEPSLFALLKMDDITDKWTVILSAPWVNDDDRGEIFMLLRRLMIQHLTEQEILLIARFGIWMPQDHLIRLTLERFRTGDRIESDIQINGNLIHEGYILAANAQLV